MTQYFPLEDNDYICVLVECAYPPQPQLFIWTKQLVNDIVDNPPSCGVTDLLFHLLQVPSSGMCWAVKKMMKVLPGRPLLHIEVSQYLCNLCS